MRAILSLTIAVSCLAGILVAAESGPLPEPQKKGGLTVLETIDRRNSSPQQGFPTGELSREDIATILWAATGHNRDGSKWTVPMAMGRPPYCHVYLADASGVYRYDWSSHALTEISQEDIRAAVNIQDFAQAAPASLYVVVDKELLAAMSEPLQGEGGFVLAGAMSQNIYLACEGIGVGTRLVYSINRDEAAQRLRLSGQQVAIFGMPMGKR
ncbi:MAG: nitroreductase family protein [Planctomycetes bacterium]|nr:nitroreductase family protein [Planctomycetota bacterium]